MITDSSIADALPRVCTVFTDPAFSPVAGIMLGTAAAGLRYRNRDDLLYISFPPTTTTAVVLTRNNCPAAPVIYVRSQLHKPVGVRALLFNCGQANAGVGQPGLDDIDHYCGELAQLTGLDKEQIMPFSTGVIGERIPLDKLIATLPKAVAAQDSANWEQAAKAIMTTDTWPKGASLCFPAAGGNQVTVTGIAKGSGMIEPDMATMLALVATDMEVPAEELQQILNDCTAQTFNRISVDSDISTNDACVLLATGSGQSWDPKLREQLHKAVLAVCNNLARQIIEDGEGVTRPFTVRVSNGVDESECDAVARAVANSPLVKTAVHARDPNWGRILAAMGKVRRLVDLDLSRVDIALNEVQILRSGILAEDYSEAAAKIQMDAAELTVHINLGRGNAVASIYAADLSAEYVRINAEYRS